MGTSVLVLGGTGYVGSRLIPELLARGHDVRVLARQAAGTERFPWAGRVEIVEGDVQDEVVVRTAMKGVQTLVYLVHGMGGDDFREADREAAELVGHAAAAEGVERAVYLSGLVPPNDEDQLSEHLMSRWEVEQVLSTHLPTVSLRAAVVLGSGSTSFEVIRQVSERLPLHTVPDWMTLEGPADRRHRCGHRPCGGRLRAR